MKHIKGDTLEKQMKSLDRLVGSLKLRAQKIVFGVTPPIISQNYVDMPETGSVLVRFMSPVNGKLLGGAVFVEKMVPKSVTLVAEIMSGGVKTSVAMVVSQGLNALKRGADLDAGDRLRVVVDSPLNLGDLGGVWTSLAFEPETAPDRFRKLAIEALENEDAEEDGEETKSPSA